MTRMGASPLGTGALPRPTAGRFTPTDPADHRYRVPDMLKPKMIENQLESFIFRSRWLLAPFYVGLVLSLLVLLLKFGQALVGLIPNTFAYSDKEIILAVLTLVDLSLVANLLLMVIFSGYENFVSKIDTADHEDRPSWMGKVDYSGLKIKLIASIVAISGIELLKAFVNIADHTNAELAWKVGIHMAFVVSGVLLALMDRISHVPTPSSREGERSVADHS
jgi:uncharacterized protein (TIGR00645 family)